MVSATQKQTTRIVLTGGGSGGHVYPLIAVAVALKKMFEAEPLSLDLLYLGPDKEYFDLFHAAGVRTVKIPGPKLRRYASIMNILDVPLFFFSFAQELWKLFYLMPDAVFSKGGTGALPVVLAAWWYRIPVMIHESDTDPGLTNLLSSRFARRIAITFDETAKFFPPQRTSITGNPVRQELFEHQLETATAKQVLGFAADAPLILVLGGSQGSQNMNEFIVVNLHEIIAKVQILHQCGIVNFIDMQKLTRVALQDSPTANRYKLVPYFTEDMSTALAAADLIVSRAGVGTISELAAFGKPAILIPHEAGNGHQRTNAYAYAHRGAAVVIEESNLLIGIFLGQITTILEDETLRHKMSAAARNFSKPESAEMIAKEVIGMIA